MMFTGVQHLPVWWTRRT